MGEGSRAAAAASGYDLDAPGGWDRFLDDIMHRRSSLGPPSPAPAPAWLPSASPPPSRRPSPAAGRGNTAGGRSGRTSHSGGMSEGSEPYPVNPALPFGGKWRQQRPPGLPTYVRRASQRGAAMSAVRAAARSHGLGAAFVSVLEVLADNESNATYALPARVFNNLPPSQRGSGERLITAWGVFQFNRDAWTRALQRLLPDPQWRQGRVSWIPRGQAGCENPLGCIFPWDCTAEEEVELPVARYAQLFQAVRQAGGTDFHAARGIRFWHRAPSLHQGYVEDGALTGFDAAWSRLPQRYTSNIDASLRAAGLTP